MALYTVLHFPDPRLKQVAKPVEDFGPEFQQLIDDMFETMYHERGVGLAATQIGIGLRVSVIDTSEDKSGQLVIVNPEIIETSGSELMSEGCLSVPGHWDKVKRATYVKLRALDRHGKPCEIEGEGLLAEAFQHEIDHLNGTLYIDYLSPLKRKIIRGKARKNR